MLELALGGLSVFDAAYAGFERAGADGGLLEAELRPGRYDVAFANPNIPSGDRVTLIRLLAPDTQAGWHGRTGVTIT